MKPLKYTVAALALIAVASFNPSAKAAFASPGDVVLGAYDANSTSIASYEVDLGAFNSLTAGESFNLGTTLTSNFSGDSSPSLVFNIFATGVSGAGGGGLTGTQYALVSTTTPTPISGRNGSTPESDINNIFADQGSTALTLPNTTSSTGVAIHGETTTDTDSFYSQGNAGFSVATNPAYPSTSSLEFYGITAGSTALTNDGTFQFSLSGTNEILTFDPVATPEPSAYALGLCAVALFFVLKRRSKVA